MTDTEASSSPTAADWNTTVLELRERFSGQKDSVLFCLHKLEQDAGVGLADLRDEAAALGIPMAGRALHSAKVLLGMATTKPRRTKAAAQPAPEQPAATTSTAARPGATRPAADGGAIEEQVLSAVRKIQSAAGAEADRMRAAIREAVRVLQDALDD